MEAAEGLYNQLEEEVHDLVSQSNSCLERLEFLRKVRELEAEFGKLGRWLDGEGAARLQEMGAEEWSPDSFEKSFERFNEFLHQATAQYRHGLALCQEAAEVQDSVFPEADSFQVAAALFQTKLVSFYRHVERRQAELEMLRELCRFSSTITWLNVGCRQCSARVKHGGSPAGCPEALQCLESSFQKLSVEFSMEKLQEMQAQVRRMQSSSGLGAWTEAWHKYQETRQILEEMLAELREAWGAQADGQGGAPGLDMGCISTTVPKAMANSLHDTRTISYEGCAAQVFLFPFLMSADLFLLTVMAYDRYVAICKPLHYGTLLGSRACAQMAAAAWGSGFLYALLHATNTFSLPLCQGNAVDQFFCEITQILKISCSDSYLREVGLLAFSGILVLGCFVFIVLSYVQIFRAVLRIPSEQGRHKAFSTCLPHLVVVSLLVSTGVSAYLNPPTISSSSLDMIMAVLYAVVPPAV
uniref:G-protein coupled receptors family 1 profile domain-containing protein n=1 Tax=Anas zonorhyncha TaxID=75864 RepID=A0A8B9ZX75_9AVES